MDIGMAKICAIALICTAVSIVGRTFCGGVSALIKVEGAVVVFSLVMISLSEVIDRVVLIVDGFDGAGRISEYWDIMLRALGIAILCRICTDICRELGETTVAGAVEMAAKLCILLLSLPIIEDILSHAEMLLSEI